MKTTFSIIAGMLLCFSLRAGTIDSKGYDTNSFVISTSSGTVRANTNAANPKALATQGQLVFKAPTNAPVLTHSRLAGDMTFSDELGNIFGLIQLDSINDTFIFSLSNYTFIGENFQAGDFRSAPTTGSDSTAQGGSISLGSFGGSTLGHSLAESGSISAGSFENARNIQVTSDNGSFAGGDFASSSNITLTVDSGIAYAFERGTSYSNVQSTVVHGFEFLVGVRNFTNVLTDAVALIAPGSSNGFGTNGFFGNARALIDYVSRPSSGATNVLMEKSDGSLIPYDLATFISLFGGGGSGSVSSVAITPPSGHSVSGSPITTSGTIVIARNGIEDFFTFGISNIGFAKITSNLNVGGSAVIGGLIATNGITNMAATASSFSFWDANKNLASLANPGVTGSYGLTNDGNGGFGYARFLGSGTLVANSHLRLNASTNIESWENAFGYTNLVTVPADTGHTNLVLETRDGSMIPFDWATLLAMVTGGTTPNGLVTNYGTVGVVMPTLSVFTNSAQANSLRLVVSSTSTPSFLPDVPTAIQFQGRSNGVTSVSSGLEANWFHALASKGGFWLDTGTVFVQSNQVSGTFTFLDTNSVLHFSSNNVETVTLSPISGGITAKIGTFNGGPVSFIPTNGSPVSLVLKSSTALPLGITNDFGGRVQPVVQYYIVDAVTGNAKITFSNEMTGEKLFRSPGSLAFTDTNFFILPLTTTNAIWRIRDESSGTGTSCGVLTNWLDGQ